MPLRLAFICASSRGIVVYIVEHMKRPFPALILSADGEHLKVVMPFTRMGNILLLIFLVLFGLVYVFGGWG